MKKYFLIVSPEARAAWEDYRKKWIKHRDAVIGFMEKVGGVEVRTNFNGAPIAVRFKHGIILPKGFRQTTWGPTGANLINRQGQKLFADDIERIAALFPKIPSEMIGFKHRAFDFESTWIAEDTPIYLIVRDTVASDLIAGHYNEITEKEFNFRVAWDEFNVEDPRESYEVLRTL